MKVDSPDLAIRGTYILARGTRVRSHGYPHSQNQEHQAYLNLRLNHDKRMPSHAPTRLLCADYVAVHTWGERYGEASILMWKDTVSSVQSVVFNSLWPHGLQHARLPCPSPTPGAYSNSCPLSKCCHSSISSSVVPLSSHLQSFQASGLCQWVSSSNQEAKVLEFQLQHQSFQWTPRTDLLYDGLVGSPCSPRDSRESSPTPQFKSTNSSVLIFLYSPTLTSILEKAMAPHSSTLTWRIPWTEEPGGLQSMGSLGVRHDWKTSLSLFTSMHWRRKCNPLQYSWLENPRDGGAWWAAIDGVAQSRTRLKRLSSSSSASIHDHWKHIGKV